MPAPRVQPIAVSDKTAAQMLDMPAARFRELVDHGAMPKPITLGNGIERWRYADLEAIVEGRARIPQDEDFDL